MLNIDELIGPKKSIQFKGVDYPVDEPTLEHILEAEKVLEAPRGDEQLSGMSELIKLLVPGLDIKKIPVRMLSALFNYVIGTEEKKTEEPAAAEITE